MRELDDEFFVVCLNLSANFFGKSNLFEQRVTAKVKFLSLCYNSSHFLFDLELFSCIDVTLLFFVRVLILLVRLNSVANRESWIVCWSSQTKKYKIGVDVK